MSSLQKYPEWTSEKWRASSPTLEPFSSKSYLEDFIEFSYIPLYQNECFLKRKYITEGRSIAQIADEISSSKDAVRRGLIRFGIPVREAHLAHGNKSQSRFGEKKINGGLLQHMGEIRIINAVQDMKFQGLSLRNIARFLSQIGVPTKCRGKKWHPEMVRRVLENF